MEICQQKKSTTSVELRVSKTSRVDDEKIPLVLELNKKLT